MRKSLILVTVSFHVFIVPHKSLKESMHKLYLNEKPKHMSKVWPELWNMPNFKKIKDHFIFNAFTVMDGESDFFCITTKWDVIKDSGPCYDINKKEAFQAYAYYGHDNQVLLSANKPIYYYAMHQVKDNLQLSQFKFRSQHLKDLNGIFLSKPWRNICKYGKNQIFSSNKLCTVPFNIPVLKGFLSNNKFYLFGAGTVTTFPLEVYTHPGEKFYFNVTMFGDFFYCPKSALMMSGMSDI